MAKHPVGYTMREQAVAVAFSIGSAHRRRLAGEIDNRAWTLDIATVLIGCVKWTALEPPADLIQLAVRALDVPDGESVEQLIRGLDRWFDDLRVSLDADAEAACIPIDGRA